VALVFVLVKLMTHVAPRVVLHDEYSEVLRVGLKLLTNVPLGESGPGPFDELEFPLLLVLIAKPVVEFEAVLLLLDTE
jgi:hypothetical protein